MQPHTGHGRRTFAGEDDAKCRLRWRPPGTLWGLVPPPSTATVGQFRTSVNVYIRFRLVTSTRHPAQPFETRGQTRTPAFCTSPRAHRHAFSPEARKLAPPPAKPPSEHFSTTAPVIRAPSYIPDLAIRKAEAIFVDLMFGTRIARDAASAELTLRDNTQDSEQTFRR